MVQEKHPMYSGKISKTYTLNRPTNPIKKVSLIYRYGVNFWIGNIKLNHRRVHSPMLASLSNGLGRFTSRKRNTQKI